MPFSKLKELQTHFSFPLSSFPLFNVWLPSIKLVAFSPVSALKCHFTPRWVGVQIWSWSWMKDQHIRQHVSLRTSEKPLGESKVEHWPLVESSRVMSVPCAECLPGRGLPCGHLHPQGCVFSPLTHFLLSRCGCFLNCISTGHRKIKSFTMWRWRFFGHVILCLLASRADRELPSFWLKLHVFFFLSFTLKAGSLIRAAFK